MSIPNKISDESMVRRSANYLPSIWEYEFIQSLRSEYGGEQYVGKMKKLKEEVKMMFEETTNPLDQLEMIDLMRRLGFSYHFKDEIGQALKRIYNNYVHHGNTHKKEDLYATALEFRLLRQHGYDIKQEIFNSFKGDQGNFKGCLCNDLKGLLYLYEASYFMVEDENIIEDAQNFSTKNLEKYVEEKNGEEYLLMLVSHALELPLHWRMHRLEARWFINVYEHNKDLKPIFLEFAKLDFNMVQAVHQEDLKHVSRWWNKTGLGEKLEFARNRSVEIFFWSVGAIYEPQYGYSRKILSKAGALITVIDDIYDVYGTLDELEIFTDAVVRWDINAMDRLPYYMKICFLALYNCINEMAFDILKDQGVGIIHYLKKGWADLCKTYLLEAKWYHSGYTPTLEEYLENGWLSISMPLLLVHTYFTNPNEMSVEASECLKEYPSIIRWASLISRLADDLGTSSLELERGDNPKSIQCYMHETGASEEEARKHLHYLIGEAWKKMNKDQIQNTVFSQTFMTLTMNMGRISQCVYQYGDGYGVQNLETKARVTSLFIKPISLITRDE